MLLQTISLIKLTNGLSATRPASSEHLQKIFAIASWVFSLFIYTSGGAKVVFSYCMRRSWAVKHHCYADPALPIFSFTKIHGFGKETTISSMSAFSIMRSLQIWFGTRFCCLRSCTCLQRSRQTVWKSESVIAFQSNAAVLFISAADTVDLQLLCFIC